MRPGLAHVRQVQPQDNGQGQVRAPRPPDWILDLWLRPSQYAKMPTGYNLLQGLDMVFGGIAAAAAGMMLLPVSSESLVRCRIGFLPCRKLCRVEGFPPPQTFLRTLLLEGSWNNSGGGYLVQTRSILRCVPIFLPVLNYTPEEDTSGPHHRILIAEVVVLPDRVAFRSHFQTWLLNQRS